MATVGTGYLNANWLLTDISNVMVETVVNTTITTVIGVGGNNVTPAGMEGIYPGAQLIIGPNTASQEVITIITVTQTTFYANFAKAHAIGASLIGATFPSCQTTDGFFTQAEVLTYLSEAQNDYLLRVQCIVARAVQNWTYTQTIMQEPADCIRLQRVAVSNSATPPIFTSLREQPQSSLDLIQPNWAQQGYNVPRLFYEDRTAYMSYGVSPAPGNVFSTWIMYAQRDASPLGFGDGFLLPDPFMVYVKYGTLAKMFSKDGQQADPARAKYFTQRFEMGVKIGAKFMAMAESPVSEVQQ